MEEISQSLDRDALAQFARHPCIQPQHRDASLFPNNAAGDLRRSAWRGNMNEVRGLLGLGADAAQTDANGKTPLMIARERNHVEVAHYIAWEHDELVRVLAKCLGRPPTQTESYGAATLNKLRKFRQRVRDYVAEVLKILLESARVGDVATVKRIVENGDIGLNVIDKTTGETAWSAALGCGQVAVCEYLMDRGARVDGTCWIKDECYDFLVAAVLTGDVRLVRLVVARGVPFRTMADDDTVPTCALTEAVRMGSIEMIETLLELGVRFDRWRNGLKLPASFAQLLRRIEPTDTSMEAEPWLLLCAACWFQDRAIFHYLIAKYSILQDLGQSRNNAANVLCLAAYRENDEMVQELLRRGAPIHCGDDCSAIVAAAVANSLRMLEFLLARGAQVDGNWCTVGTNYRPLLAAAVYCGSTDCARLLETLETRLEYREAAFVSAVEVDNLEMATLLAGNIAEFSVVSVHSCVKMVRCPLILDLLLSSWCDSRFPVSTFNAEFSKACREGKSTDLLGVFVAHGIDITLDTTDGLNKTSPLMKSVLGGWTDDVSPATLEFVLANGMPSLTTDWSGMTPEIDLETRGSDVYSPSEAQKDSYAMCRAVLAAYS